MPNLNNQELNQRIVDELTEEINKITDARTKLRPEKLNQEKAFWQGKEKAIKNVIEEIEDKNKNIEYPFRDLRFFILKKEDLISKDLPWTEELSGLSAGYGAIRAVLIKCSIQTTK